MRMRTAIRIPNVGKAKRPSSEICTAQVFFAADLPQKSVTGNFAVTKRYITLNLAILKKLLISNLD